MRIRAVGANALLLEVDDPAAWFTQLWHRREAGELDPVEIVPGATTVLLDGLTDPAATAGWIRTWAGNEWVIHEPLPNERDAHEADPLVVPVSFDGVDLDDIAHLWGMTRDDVIDQLIGTQFRVAFCGFTPGWGYLTGLPGHLRVPRLDTPRTKVPAGSVALADTYAGIYPTASPGGWRIVGHTELLLFDADRDPPALLTPGRPVSLRLAAQSEAESQEAQRT